MLTPPASEPVFGNSEDQLLDTSGVDIRLPMLVYVSREKRPGYDHNKKAGAMNALVRSSAIMSNGPFILNLDCDHYVYNSLAMKEAMCFMMDRGGERICYVQFPQRFEGVDPNDRYANHNTVFFDVNMRALDGLQGPMYVGTGCVFRRVALYGFDPPRATENGGFCCFGRKRRKVQCKRSPWLLRLRQRGEEGGKQGAMTVEEDDGDEDMEAQLIPRKFGSSTSLVASIPVAEMEGKPLADYAGIANGRPSGLLTAPRQPLDAGPVAEAINVISCWYEEKTEWGTSVGWIYGSVTEDVVTGYRMHDRGWRSVYCVTKRDAFRGTAPINLTDRLHQVLRWATGSVEIFFSRNNALFGSSRLKPLQRIAYLNVGIYPFTSIFLVVYCFLPALSLVTGQFIVESMGLTFLVLLLAITASMCMLAMLEIKWSGITLHEWWRNEQFWLTGGTSAHPAAVMQGLLKVVAGVDISFTLTAKSSSAADDAVDEYAELYEFRWSALMIPPLTIIMTNAIAIAIALGKAVYSKSPDWSKLLGGVFFSAWVLAHLYPFSKGLMGRRRRTPTIVFVWSGLLAIIISLMWVSVSSPASSSSGLQIQPFQFP
jgi:1,4-beta-D-xylan synthase